MCRLNSSKIRCDEGFIVNPTVELTPVLRISPFMDSDLYPLGDRVDDNYLDYLNKRFRNWRFTLKARSALWLALAYYHLQKEDVVTILTTSGNFYISGCVTKTIESFCQWSREITDRTKVILVNHEFGYPYENLSKLKEYGIPVIEDCAQTFISSDCNQEIGTVGDFVIYSLPKYFPMQIGGLLMSSRFDLNEFDTNLPEEAEKYISSRLSHYASHIEKWARQRLSNYYYLQDKLKPLGIQPFFKLEKGTVPGVFLFRWRDDINYPRLKEYMQANGVESSVFYGENAFFIPLNHALKTYQLDYMITLLKHFNDGMS
jgi:hypothetical protein